MASSQSDAHSLKEVKLTINLTTLIWILTSPGLNSIWDECPGTLFSSWAHLLLPSPHLPRKHLPPLALQWELLQRRRGEGPVSWLQVFPTSLGRFPVSTRHGMGCPGSPLTSCTPMPWLRGLDLYLCFPISLLLFQKGLLPLCYSFQQMASPSVLAFLCLPLWVPSPPISALLWALGG